MKSTLAFFSLFFFLDLTFLLLAIAHFNTVDGGVNLAVQKAAGIFGLITAFIAWWNALAGIAESSNSFFTIPVRSHPQSDILSRRQIVLTHSIQVLHFPWSEKVKAERRASKSD